MEKSAEEAAVERVYGDGVLFWWVIGDGMGHYYTGDEHGASTRKVLEAKQYMSNSAAWAEFLVVRRQQGHRWGTISLVVEGRDF